MTATQREAFCLITKRTLELLLSVHCMLLLGWVVWVWALFLPRDKGKRNRQGENQSFPAATQREKEQILHQGRLCKQRLWLETGDLGKQRKRSLFSPTPARAQSQSWDCLLWQGTPCPKGLSVPKIWGGSAGFPFGAEKRTTPNPNL